MCLWRSRPAWRYGCGAGDPLAVGWLTVGCSIISAAIVRRRAGGTVHGGGALLTATHVAVGVTVGAVGRRHLRDLHRQRLFVQRPCVLACRHGRGGSLRALRTGQARVGALAAGARPPRRGRAATARPRGAASRASTDRSRDARRARPSNLAAQRPRGRARIQPGRVARGDRPRGSGDPDQCARGTGGVARGDRRPACE